MLDIQVLPIYVINVIRLDKCEPGGFVSRAWGWYPDLSTCQKIVLENQTDIFEDGYYRYAMIERVPYGVMPEITETWWFEATYTKATADPGRVIRDPEVRGIDTPARFTKLAGFSLG